jgi:hypothetical protein
VCRGKEAWDRYLAEGIEPDWTLVDAWRARQQWLREHYVGRRRITNFRRPRDEE